MAGPVAVGSMANTDDDVIGALHDAYRGGALPWVHTLTYDRLWYGVMAVIGFL